MTHSQTKALEAYVELLNTNASAHLFRTAVELGVFDCLANGQMTAANVAERCDTQAEPTEWLLDALCSIGVVERYGDDFAIAQVMHLVAEGFHDLGDRYWRHLPQFVRTGQSFDDETDFHRESRSSQWMMTPAAMQLARVLDVGRSRSGLNVLELSAGAAVWSLSLAYTDPAMQITVVDNAAGIAATKENAAAIGVSDRLHAVEDDYRTVELPERAFDLVLVANLMHLSSLEANTALLQRLRPCLKAGGELAIVDRFAGQDPGELHQRLFRLSVAMRTTEGRVHTPQELQQAIIAASFAKPRFAHLPAPPYTLGVMLAARNGD